MVSVAVVRCQCEGQIDCFLQVSTLDLEPSDGEAHKYSYKFAFAKVHPQLCYIELSFLPGLGATAVDFCTLHYALHPGQPGGRRERMTQDNALTT